MVQNITVTIVSLQNMKILEPGKLFEKLMAHVDCLFMIKESTLKENHY